MAKQPDKTYSVGDMAIAIASAKGISTDRASKDVRRKLRANHPTVVQHDAAVAERKPVHNDGTPWPKDMNADTFAFVVEGTPYPTED